MKRREFIAGVGSVAAWPIAARAQFQTTAVVGWLAAGTLDTTREIVTPIHRGLAEAGFVESRNLAVEYRWAEYRLEQLPALANDLVRRQVAVIVAPSTPSALAAKAATNSVPIVFAIASDPVELGLVASLNRPGRNLTGISHLDTATAGKRLALLRELTPASSSFALLVNPTSTALAETEIRELQAAAHLLGVRLLILNASDPSEFETAFSTLLTERTGGLLVSSDAVFSNHLNQLIALAARYRVPSMYRGREATVAGGLMSYGTDFPDLYRQVGIYAGRILKGERPADLPVQQVTKIQLAINLKTAKALGLTLPETLLATADEVIQ